jgi:hypothetical protein
VASAVSVGASVAIDRLVGVKVGRAVPMGVLVAVGGGVAVGVPPQAARLRPASRATMIRTGNCFHFLRLI